MTLPHLRSLFSQVPEGEHATEWPAWGYAVVLGVALAAILAIFTLL